MRISGGAGGGSRHTRLVVPRRRIAGAPASGPASVTGSQPESRGPQPHIGSGPGARVRRVCSRTPKAIVSIIPQHDPPHRTAEAVDPGQQIGPRCAAAATMAHAVEDVADQHVALGHVRLGDHPFLAAALAHDAEEPAGSSPREVSSQRRRGRGRAALQTGLTIQSAPATSLRAADEPGLSSCSKHQVRGEFAQQTPLPFRRFGAAECYGVMCEVP